MKLFVGNLSYDATETELREQFEEFEPILDFHRPLDRETGMPRGFAFVTLADRETGEKAIAALDSKELHGRALRVNEAEDRRGPSAPRHRSEHRVDLSSRSARPKDDRPIGKDGKRVRYKGI